MRIAFIATNRNAPTGGSEELWTKTALKGHEGGHEVICIVYDWKSPHPAVVDLEKKGVPIIKRKLRGKHQGLVHRGALKIRHLLLSRLKGSDFELRRLIKYQPDLICISQASSYDVAYGSEFITFFRKTSIPFVLISHSYRDDGMFAGDHLNNAKELYSKARRIFYVASKQLETIEKQLMTHLDNAQKVINPINLSSAESLRETENSEVRFAIVGSLVTRWKGHDIALEALSSKRWKEREWTLDIYGTGADERLIKELIEFYGIQDRVILKGYESDIKSIWLTHDVLLMPSRVEAAPLVLSEAMICGRTAVVTDIGDMASTVEDGITGFVAAAPGVKYFSEAMERMWEKRNDLSKFGLEAHKRLMAKYYEKPEQTLLNLMVNG